MERRYPGTSLLRGIVVLAAVVAMAVEPASVSAADQGAVDASVEVQNPAACILLEGTVIDFGMEKFSTPSHTEQSEPSTPTTVTNCSGAAADLVARGTKASNEAGTAQWTLVPTLNPCDSGPNAFVHGVLLGVGAGAVLSETNQSVIDENPSHFPDGQQLPFKHIMMMPCTGSGGDGDTMSWTVIFTAILP